MSSPSAQKQRNKPRINRTAKEEFDNEGGEVGGGGGSGGGGPRPKREPPPDPHMQAGIVKGVVSGDSLIIIEVDDTHRKQAKEILFTLIGIKVRQLPRRNETGLTQEEPFAWQSREFLRKMVIGKPVVYREEHGVGNRKYGELWTHEEEDVRRLLLGAGWAEVLVKQPRKGRDGQDLEPSYDQQQLEEAQEDARTNKRGMWNPKAKDTVRNVKVHDVYRDVNTQELYSDELFDFYKRVKDKRPLKGIVEMVRNATSYVVYLPDTQDQFPLLLSGVRLPSKRGVIVGSGGGGSAEESEIDQFLRESKFYAEYYVLHRDVTIYIDGVDKINIFGTIIAGEVNIARTLLELGMVVFVDWSAPKDPTLVDNYRKAEKQAQEKRRKIWVDHTPKPPSALLHMTSGEGSTTEDTRTTKETNITGTVVEVVNSGTITVRVSKADAQKTVDRIITLSSIRAPRMLKPEDMSESAKAKMEPEERKKKEEEVEEIKRELAIAAEAKEFLRNTLIGKKVKCIFDYPRSFQSKPNSPPQVRLYWSVYITETSNEKNVAVDLVKQGLGRVVMHPEDELRATDYQDLVVAEKNAEAARRGIHGSSYRQSNIINLTPPPKTTEEDKAKTTGLLSKCKQYFTFFQNKPRIEAIVDYVFAASRFKMTVPSQNCVIMFTLMGCIVDKPVKSSEDITVKPDISPFDKQFPPSTPGNKALHFVRDQVYQRKVHVSILSLDNFGNFLGQMFINNKDFTLTLLEHGHARLHFRIAKKLQNFEAYRTAEDKAREQRKGLWETFDFEQEELIAQARESFGRRPAAGGGVVGEGGPSQQVNKGPFPIIVTDIRSGNTFSYQIQNEETNALNELSLSLQNEHFANHPPYTPKRGDLVAAQFTIDDMWYRAEVLTVIQQAKKKEEEEKKPTQYEVRYFDYGNREILPVSRIRKLGQAYIDLMSPQAKDAKLVGVKAPDEDNAQDAVEGFKELVSNKTLFAMEISTEKSTSKDSKVSSLIHNVVLTDQNVDLGLELIANGYTRVDKKLRHDDPLYALYHEAEEHARKERLGIWQYGYNPDSDEEREDERQRLR